MQAVPVVDCGSQRNARFLIAQPRVETQGAQRGIWIGRRDDRMANRPGMSEDVCRTPHSRGFLFSTVSLLAGLFRRVAHRVKGWVVRRVLWPGDSVQVPVPSAYSVFGATAPGRAGKAFSPSREFARAIVREGEVLPRIRRRLSITTTRRDTDDEAFFNAAGCHLPGTASTPGQRGTL